MIIKTTIEYHTPGGNYKCPSCQMWFNEKEYDDGILYTHWESTHGRGVPEISLKQLEVKLGNFLDKLKTGQ